MAERVTLYKGDKIFYGGDMANQSDFGTVTRVLPPDRWGGPYVDMTLDDGRKICGFAMHMFSPEYKGHGGTRWVTMAAYQAWQEAYFMEYQARADKPETL